MSCLTKSQFKYLSNDGEEKFYDIGNGDGDDEFDFQYVPVNEFKHIIKDVRRQRIRDEEERVWSTFLKEQEQQVLNHQSCNESKYKSSRTLAESLEEVDRELMRLEADALPETNFHIGSASARDCQEQICSAKSTKRNSPTTKENGTGSTNFLLTIPEENICCRRESSEPCRTFIRKSCSDQTFKNHRIRSRCYHYSTNDLEYNSSPDVSPDRFSDENDSIPVRPDPIAVTKILGLQRKIYTVLDSISFELDRIPLPDGENDLLKRKQREVEFSTRLSRNYLYDLGRQITNIQRHINAISPNNKMRLTRRGIILHMQAIEQKLISTHQLLLAALTAYWKHIPSSVIKNYPGKLKEILQVVIQLKNICTEINLTPDFYCSGDDRDAFLDKETENRCSAILSKFRSGSDNESQVPSQTTRSTVMTPRSKKQRSRKQLASRLSMYTMDMRLAKNIQPRKSYSMYQLSRDKKGSVTALKHQPSNITTSKKSNVSLSMKAPYDTIRNKVTKISIPIKEDDIQTMMENVPSDLESPKSIKSSKRSELHDKLQKTIDIYGNTKDSERLKKNVTNHNEGVLKADHTREKCFSTLLPVIGDLLSLIQNKQSNSNSLPSDSIDALQNYIQMCQSKVDIHEPHSYHNAEDKVEIGTKNMRLICYSAKEEEEGKFVNISEHKEIVKFNDASCQAHSLKSIGTLGLSVPKTTASCLNEYRNQYLFSLKYNSMYTSNTQNKPWEVVAWIADKLVEELIVELADDFQMEDIIQKLFDLEFQEF